MRKRRRLVNKIMIMSCAVMVSVSAFFYAPMETQAALGSTVNVGSDSSPRTEMVMPTLYLSVNSSSINYEGVQTNSDNFVATASLNLPLTTWSKSVTVNSGIVEQLFNINLSHSHSVSDVGIGYEYTPISVYFVHNGQKYFGQISHVSGTNYSISFDFFSDSGTDITYFDNYSHTLYIDYLISLWSANYTTTGYNFRFDLDPYIVLGRSDMYLYRYKIYSGSNVTSDMLQNQTDSLTNGFDSSQGNSVNSDLSAGLNEFQSAEDSLFTTASSGLDDFSFFNFASIPAMVTGMSFVSSIMTSWFNQAGGASGVGIVLSILFSIMLVAMVLGLYRWYQSKGGKD